METVVIDITTEYERALEETNKLLEKENVIIYEAAIKHNDLLLG